MKTENNTEKWDLMAKYFASEVSEDGKAELMNWVNENIENEILFFESQKDWEILNVKNTMKEVNVDNAWKKLKNRIDEEKALGESNEKRKVFILSSYMKYAALGLLLIGIGYISSKIYSNIFESKKQIEYLADIKGNNEIILPDGTKVTLYPNSKLVYQKNFAQNERKVILEGEAYFDVTKNPEKPFIIDAQNTEIKVLGTSFNVNTNLPESQVEVFVETGLVQVTRKNGLEKSVLIYPGDVVKVSKSNINQSKNTNENIIAWKTRQIVFKEDSLSTVINTLNKVYKTNITCSDSSILTMRFTSIFKSQELDSILSVICLANNLKIAKENNEIRLIQNSD